MINNKYGVENPLDFELKVNEWIETATGRDDKESRGPEPMYSNFVSLTDNAKIEVCDSITQLAKNVFGPSGGYYTRSRKGGPHDMHVYTDKSKDGHGFFTSINLYNRIPATLLQIIQGYTEYVSNKHLLTTSKDGTTSLALLSANCAKFALIERELIRHNNKDPRLVKQLLNVPSTILNLLFDVIKFEGTSLIDKHKTIIYDEESGTYLTEKSRDMVMDVVKTTTDDDQVILEAISNLISYCDKNKFNLTKITAMKEEFRPGPPKIEFTYRSGYKAKCSSLDDTVASGWSDKPSIVFILDGYVAETNEAIFIDHLKKFIGQLANVLVDENRKSILDPANENAYTLLFMVNRTASSIVSKYKSLTHGITVRTAFGESFAVKPEFIQIRDDEFASVNYDDICNIFQDSVIDLNAINGYLNSLRDPKMGYDTVLNRWKPTQATEPNLIGIQLMPRVYQDHIVKTKLEKTGVLKALVVNDDIKFDVNEYEVVPNKEITKFENLLTLTSYDGIYTRLRPSSDEVHGRAEELKEKLLSAYKSLDASFAEDPTPLVERIKSLDEISVYPIIYTMNDSEASQIKSLYEDAIGVLFSVHRHGVMPGANTFMIKFMDELRSRVKVSMQDYLSKINPDKFEIYMQFTEHMLDAIENGYNFVYSLLDYDHQINIPRIKKLKDEDSILTIYNVVTGLLSDNVVESATTTKDNFVAAVSVMKDMLLIKSIGITENDIRDSIISNKYPTISAINLTHVRGTMCEQYKEKYCNDIKATGGDI